MRTVKACAAIKDYYQSAEAVVCVLNNTTSMINWAAWCRKKIYPSYLEDRWDLENSYILLESPETKDPEEKHFLLALYEVNIQEEAIMIDHPENVSVLC